MINRSIILLLLLSFSVQANCKKAKTMIPIPKDVLKSSTQYQISPDGNFIAIHNQESSLYKIENSILNKLEDIKIKRFRVINANWSVLSEYSQDSTKKVNSLFYFNLNNKKFTKLDSKNSFTSNSISSINSINKTGYGSEINYTILNYDSKFSQHSLSLDKNQNVKNTKHTLINKKLCSNIIDSFDRASFSKEFEEISHIMDNKLIILKIKNDYSCKQVDHLDFDTDRVNFSYKEFKKKGSIIYTSQVSIIKRKKLYNTVSVFIYNRDEKKISRVSSEDEFVIDQPKFLRDNRISYIDLNKSRLVILDPNCKE